VDPTFDSLHDYRLESTRPPKRDRDNRMPRTSQNNKRTQRTPFPDGLAQPALRALAGAGLDHLEQLSKVPEETVRELHGIGPNALNTLRGALATAGLSFARVKKIESHSAPEVDAYIAQFPARVQTILQKVRKTIRKAAPEAKEVISYKLPAYRQHGILVYFAGWKEHIGLYPPISGDKALEKATALFAGPKGNLQFPLDQPIPYDLIARIVTLRVTQDAEKRRKRK